jgi:hypothetical protein
LVSSHNHAILALLKKSMGETVVSEQCLCKLSYALQDCFLLY